MSVVGDIFDGLRKAIAVGDDVSRLTKDMSELNVRERELRERVAYIEGVIAGAQGRTARGRLPRP